MYIRSTISPYLITCASRFFSRQFTHMTNIEYLITGDQKCPTFYMRIMWHFRFFGYWIVREESHKNRWSGILGLWCNIYLVNENSCVEIHNSNPVEYYVQANRLIFTWITVWACKESENRSSINDFSSSSKHDSKDGSTWLNSKPNVRNCKEDFLF